MARNYTAAEAIKIVIENKEHETIADIAKRFPFVVVYASQIGANPAFLTLVNAFPDYFTVRKLNKSIMTNLGIAERDEEIETPEDDEEEDVEEENVTVKKKRGRKAKSEKVVKEEDEEDEDEEEIPVKKTRKNKKTKEEKLVKEKKAKKTKDTVVVKEDDDDDDDDFDDWDED